MRSLEECREEIFRRSRERIKKRHQRRISLLIVCVPVILCITVVGLFAVKGPGLFDNTLQNSNEPYDTVLDDSVKNDMSTQTDDIWQVIGYAGVPQQNTDNDDGTKTDLETIISQQQDGVIVLPPTRTGTSGFVSGRLARSYTLEEAFEAADAVAIIEVGNWICESEEFSMTWFLSSPIRIYKGELPETFALVQLGYSKYTVNHYPLFSYGEKLLVFLSLAKSEWFEVGGYKIPEFWWIIGDYSSIAYIEEDVSGNTYLMDWLGIIGKSIPNAKNYVGVPSVYRELKKNLKASNDIIGQQDPQRGFQYVITLEDFEKAIQNLLSD